MALLLLSLAALALYNFFSTELLLRLIFVLAYTLGLEYVLWKARGITPFVPSAGMVTALIIFLLFDEISPLYLTIIPITLAVVQKQFLRLGGQHIFNPAVFGLFLAGLLGYPTFWWGVSWGLAPLVITVLGGIYVTMFTLRQQWIIIPYLASSLLIYIITAGAGNLLEVIQAFTAGAFWFFAFVMLPEPITSPHKKLSRLVYATVVAGLPVVFNLLPLPIPGDLFLLSLLLGNLLGFALDRWKQLG